MALPGYAVARASRDIDQHARESSWARRNGYRYDTLSLSADIILRLYSLLRLTATPRAFVVFNCLLVLGLFRVKVTVTVTGTVLLLQLIILLQLLY